jgi:hypothetical protein
MRTFQLLAMLLVLLLAPLVRAENYSCRDNQGRWYFSDSLANLPEECLDRAQTYRSDDPVDNLNYVPSAAEPGDGSLSFENSVREVEHDQQRQEQRSKQLLQRAEQLADRYETDNADRRRALRRWNYRSRETIRTAEESIQQVREGKQQLLSELSAAALSSQEEQRIKEILKRIAE